MDGFAIKRRRTRRGPSLRRRASPPLSRVVRSFRRSRRPSQVRFDRHASRGSLLTRSLPPHPLRGLLGSPLRVAAPRVPRGSLRPRRGLRVAPVVVPRLERREAASASPSATRARPRADFALIARDVRDARHRRPRRRAARTLLSAAVEDERPPRPATPSLERRTSFSPPPPPPPPPPPVSGASRSTATDRPPVLRRLRLAVPRAEPDRHAAKRRGGSLRAPRERLVAFFDAGAARAPPRPGRRRDARPPRGASRTPNAPNAPNARRSSLRRSSPQASRAPPRREEGFVFVRVRVRVRVARSPLPPIFHPPGLLLSGRLPSFASASASAPRLVPSRPSARRSRRREQKSLGRRGAGADSPRNPRRSPPRTAAATREESAARADGSPRGVPRLLPRGDAGRADAPSAALRTCAPLPRPRPPISPSSSSSAVSAT